MSLGRIAWIYLWSRMLTTGLTILSVALAVGLISAILTLRNETRARFEEEQQAYDIVFRHGLDVDETGERLILGSSTGSLWISENGGDSWDTVSTHLPQIYCVRFSG